MTRLSWFLLQNTGVMGVHWFKEESPVNAIILALAVTVVVVILVILNIKKVGIGDTGIRIRKTSDTDTESSGPRKFSGFALRRAAHSYGLNKEQTKLLESVFRLEAVTDPALVMDTPELLDKHFKNAYRRIERNSESEEDAQKRLSVLFSVRNSIDFSHNVTASSTPPKVAANMAAVLALGGDSYPVKVINVKDDMLLTECPHNAQGSLIKIPKGSRVDLSFFTKSSKGFTLNGQVVGTEDSGQALQISRSGQAKNLSPRKFRRRQVSINCTYAAVNLREVSQGRKKEMKMTVSKRRTSGSILDISIGGCAIKTSGSVAPGSRIEIEFQYSDSLKVAVLGQVLRLNQSGGSTVMHTKFLKVPRKAMNAINAAVFDYTD